MQMQVVIPECLIKKSLVEHKLRLLCTILSLNILYREHIDCSFDLILALNLFYPAYHALYGDIPVPSLVQSTVTFM